MRQSLFRFFSPALVTLSAVGCGGGAHAVKTPASAANRQVVSAIAEMYPVKRSNVHGLLRFRATDQGVLLRGNLSGLVAGRYGFGIHESRDCSAVDPKTVGSYLGSAAGASGAPPFGHLDDLVIEHADKPEVNRVETRLSLTGKDSIVGRTLVVEAWPTDPQVDPATVPLSACGVIREE